MFEYGGSTNENNVIDCQWYRDRIKEGVSQYRICRDERIVRIKKHDDGMKRTVIG